MLGWIIIFSLLGSVGALSGAALVLILPEKQRRILTANLISYATGTLLGAVFLGLVPKALKETTSPRILVWLLVGILFFFVMEKLVLWRHCHTPDCDVHASAGPLLLIGDAFHNFTDGVIIAGAFLLSLPLGIATGLAVISHEIPQELGDFAILLESGYSRTRALLYNLVSSLATLPGALLGYYFFNAPDARGASYPFARSGQFPLHRAGGFDSIPAPALRLGRQPFAACSDTGRHRHYLAAPLALKRERR